MDMQVGNGDLGPPVWLRGDFGCSFCLIWSQKTTISFADTGELSSLLPGEKGMRLQQVWC